LPRGDLARGSRLKYAYARVGERAYRRRRASV